MSDLISRSELAKAMGVENAVKYGNETAEQQHNSYDTLMKYEIADYIEDAPAVDAVPVVRCEKCAKAKKFHNPQMGDLILCNEYRVFTDECGFCHKGAKMDGGAEG